MSVCKRCWFRISSGGGRRAGPTPLVELIREDEALGVLQRGVFSLVSQEVAQLCGGQHATVTGIVPEYGVEFRPPQQLPAELLDLYVVQTIVSGSVTPLGCVDGLGWGKKDTPIKQNVLLSREKSPFKPHPAVFFTLKAWFSEEPDLETGSWRSTSLIWGTETEGWGWGGVLMQVQ